MNRFLITLAAASGLIGAIPSTAQEKPVQGCNGAEARQFDFWIGEWRVTENGKLAGHSRIEALLEGCALLESWSGAQGGAGKSLNFFDRDDGLWHQTWIDRSGGALFLAGGFSKGAMRLTGERPASDKQSAMRHRITWTVQADGSVRQLWESSPPGKEEWATQFDGRYDREKAAAPSN